MATRFFASIARPLGRSVEDHRSRSPGTGFTMLFNARHLRFETDDVSDTMVLPGWGGIIVGTLFSRDGKPRRVLAMPEDETAKVRQSRGRHLLQNYWGGYVAFIVDPSGRSIHVVRDPSGALPCYYYEHNNQLILSSDPDTLFESLHVVPEIDWPGLGRYLLAPDIRTEDTALKGLKDLRPGFSLVCEGGTRELCELWSPWDFVNPATDRTASESMEALAETLEGCVQAWGGRFSHVLLGVSGGLDSSIIAALLAKTTNLTLLTMATHDPSGDERRYARILAEHIDAPLFEATYDVRDVDIDTASSPAQPLPIGTPILQPGLRRKAALAAERGVDAFFSGAGGDNVFCLTHSIAPLRDRMKSGATTKELWHTLIDICRLTRCSIWDALSATAKANWGHSTPAWLLNPLFLETEEIGQINVASLHPWLQAPDNALPGRFAHIRSMLKMQVSPDLFPRKNGAPQILPLMSQPIQELCYSIPTWQWVSGGQNRSVAREAARRWLPEALLRRRSKAGPSSFAYELMTTHRHDLPERLLDGRLAQSGLLNVEALRRTLADPRPFAIHDRVRMTSFLEVEAWLKHWESKAETAKEQSSITPNLPAEATH